MSPVFRGLEKAAEHSNYTYHYPNQFICNHLHMPRTEVWLSMCSRQDTEGRLKSESLSSRNSHFWASHFKWKSYARDILEKLLRGCRGKRPWPLGNWIWKRWDKLISGLESRAAGCLACLEHRSGWGCALEMRLEEHTGNKWESVVCPRASLCGF